MLLGGYVGFGCLLDLTLLGSVDQESTATSSLDVAIVSCTAAIAVRASVVDQKREVAATGWKIMVTDAIRSISLPTSFVGVFPCKVVKHSKACLAGRSLRGTAAGGVGVVAVEVKQHADRHIPGKAETHDRAGIQVVS